MTLEEFGLSFVQNPPLVQEAVIKPYLSDVMKEGPDGEGFPRFFTQAKMFSKESGIETRAARMIEKIAILSFQQV
jgi:hypothetical protein